MVNIDISGIFRKHGLTICPSCPTISLQSGVIRQSPASPWPLRMQQCLQTAVRSKMMETSFWHSGVSWRFLGSFMCFKGSTASSIFFPLCFSFKFVTSILSSRNHLTQSVFYPPNKGVYGHMIYIYIIYLHFITEYKHSFMYISITTSTRAIYMFIGGGEEKKKRGFAPAPHDEILEPWPVARHYHEDLLQGHQREEGTTWPPGGRKNQSLAEGTALCEILRHS